MKAIRQIELSSKCNLKCVYCVSRNLTRKPEFISEENFIRSLEFCKEIGQEEELWLHGCGEPFLHPRIKEYLRIARDFLPFTNLKTSSNGLILTKEILDVLRINDIMLHISVHTPNRKELATIVYEAHLMGVLEHLGCGPIQSAGNWAGQVDWPDYSPRGICSWTKNQHCLVLSDGSIATCCSDAYPVKVIGHISDDFENLKKLKIEPIDLCKTCHLTHED